jgi:hypothetical protein
MIELVQKHIGKKRIFTVEKKGVRYQRFEEGKFINELYKWENIGFDETIISQLPTKFEFILFGSLMMNILTLTVPFTLDGNDKVIGVVIGVFTLATIFISKKLFAKKYEKILTGGYPLSFFYFENHKNDVDNFINVLKKNKIDYLKHKYIDNEEYDNIESYHNRLNWLRDEEILTDEEYKILKGKKINSVIGFSNKT